MTASIQLYSIHWISIYLYIDILYIDSDVYPRPGSSQETSEQETSGDAQSQIPDMDRPDPCWLLGAGDGVKLQLILKTEIAKEATVATMELAKKQENGNTGGRLPCSTFMSIHPPGSGAPMFDADVTIHPNIDASNLQINKHALQHSFTAAIIVSLWLSFCYQLSFRCLLLSLRMAVLFPLFLSLSFSLSLSQ